MQTTPRAAMSPRGLPGPTDQESLRLEIFPADLDATVDFYCRILHFELERDQRDDPSPYVAMTRGRVRLGAAQRSASVDLRQRRPTTGVEIVIEVSDVLEERHRVARLWPLDEDLTDRPWGLTDFRVIDPSGYYLRLTSF